MGSVGGDMIGRRGVPEERARGVTSESGVVGFVPVGNIVESDVSEVIDSEVASDS